MTAIARQPLLTTWTDPQHGRTHRVEILGTGRFLLFTDETLASLRAQIDQSDLPRPRRGSLEEVRRQAARYRTERNQLREELAALRAELTARSDA